MIKNLQRYAITKDFKSVLTSPLGGKLFTNVHDVDITIKTTLGKIWVESDGTIIVSSRITSPEERVKVGKDAIKFLDRLAQYERDS